MRAKIDLLNFVSGKCGIINPENPYRCPKKTRLLIERGVVNKEKLNFNTDYIQKINEIVVLKKDGISDKIQLEMHDLFQDSPFQIKRKINLLIDELVISS